MGRGLHERTDFGMPEHLVEDGNRRCGSLVLMEYFAEYLRLWLELDHCGHHLGLDVLVLVEAEVNADVRRAVVISLGVKIGYGAAVSYLDGLRQLDGPVDANRYRQETDVQGLSAFCLDACDGKSRVMTWVKRPGRYSPTGAAESGIVL